MIERNVEPCNVCMLCGRVVPKRMLTLHHLLPKQKGGKADDRARLCRPCHKQIHATFDNSTLAREYSDLDALKRAVELQPFLKWIRKQSADRNFRTDMSLAHPGTKRSRIRQRRRFR